MVSDDTGLVEWTSRDERKLLLWLLYQTYLNYLNYISQIVAFGSAIICAHHDFQQLA